MASSDLSSGLTESACNHTTYQPTKTGLHTCPSEKLKCFRASPTSTELSSPNTPKYQHQFPTYQRNQQANEYGPERQNSHSRCSRRHLIKNQFTHIFTRQILLSSRLTPVALQLLRLSPNIAGSACSEWSTGIRENTPLPNSNMAHTTGSYWPSWRD